MLPNLPIYHFVDVDKMGNWRKKRLHQTILYNKHVHTVHVHVHTVHVHLYVFNYM